MKCRHPRCGVVLGLTFSQLEDGVNVILTSLKTRATMGREWRGVVLIFSWEPPTHCDVSGSRCGARELKSIVFIGFLLIFNGEIIVDQEMVVTYTGAYVNTLSSYVSMQQYTRTLM